MPDTEKNNQAHVLAIEDDAMLLRALGDYLIWGCPR
jgi:hypothetical protein